jgi:hypothetical protein
MQRYLIKQPVVKGTKTDTTPSVRSSQIPRGPNIFADGHRRHVFSGSSPPATAATTTLLLGGRIRSAIREVHGCTYFRLQVRRGHLPIRLAKGNGALHLGLPRRARNRGRKVLCRQLFRLS